MAYAVKEADCNLPCLENQNDVELKSNGLVYLPEKNSRQGMIQAHGEKAVTITKETSATEETPPALHRDTRREIHKIKLHPPKALLCEDPNSFVRGKPELKGFLLLKP